MIIKGWYHLVVRMKVDRMSHHDQQHRYQTDVEQIDGVGQPGQDHPPLPAQDGVYKPSQTTLAEVNLDHQGQGPRDAVEDFVGNTIGDTRFYVI